MTWGCRFFRIRRCFLGFFCPSLSPLRSSLSLFPVVPVLCGCGFVRAGCRLPASCSLFRLVLAPRSAVFLRRVCRAPGVRPPALLRAGAVLRPGVVFLRPGSLPSGCPPLCVFAVLFGFVACFLFGFVLCLLVWFGAGAGVRARCRFWRCPVALRSFARSSVRSVRFPLARRLVVSVSRLLFRSLCSSFALPRVCRSARVLRALRAAAPVAPVAVPLFALPAPAAFPPALACAALLPAGVAAVGCGAAPRSPSGASFFWVFPVCVSVSSFAAGLSRSFGARVSVRCVAGAAWRVSVPCLPCLPARCSVGF